MRDISDWEWENQGRTNKPQPKAPKKQRKPKIKRGKSCFKRLFSFIWWLVRFTFRLFFRVATLLGYVALACLLGYIFYQANSEIQAEAQFTAQGVAVSTNLENAEVGSKSRDEANKTSTPSVSEVSEAIGDEVQNDKVQAKAEKVGVVNATLDIAQKSLVGYKEFGGFCKAIYQNTKVKVKDFIISLKRLRLVTEEPKVDKQESFTKKVDAQTEEPNTNVNDALETVADAKSKEDNLSSSDTSETSKDDDLRQSLKKAIKENPRLLESKEIVQLLLETEE
ncbi:MAG: hypothetical protein ACOX3T_00100 [Bdellovibrionota bacterium]